MRPDETARSLLLPLNAAKLSGGRVAVSIHDPDEDVATLARAILAEYPLAWFIDSLMISLPSGRVLLIYGIAAPAEVCAFDHDAAERAGRCLLAIASEPGTTRASA